MKPKPLIKKEADKWVAWMPIEIAHSSAQALKVAYSTWKEALQAVGI